MRRLVLALAFVVVPLGVPAVAALRPPAQVRAEFRKLLDRPRVPLDPQPAAEPKTDAGLVVEKLTIATEKKRDGKIERVPLLIVRPAAASPRRPAVLVLHGTGGNKEGQRDWLDRLAAKGFFAVAIDARYHGERAGGTRGSEAYVAASTAAWRAKPSEQEHPFFYDTVWDIWRTIDYLVSRPEIDRARIGVIGFSMGGIETWMAAAADERVRVAAPAIAVQSFRYSLENELWESRARTIWATHEAAAQDLGEKTVNQRVCRAVWTKILPGILDRFDGPDLLPLIAPRPLLVTNGEIDPRNPLPGAKLAFDAAEAAYKKAGASDKVKILVAPGVAHKVTDEHKAEIMAWLLRWLTPPPDRVETQ